MTWPEPQECKGNWWDGNTIHLPRQFNRTTWEGRSVVVVAEPMWAAMLEALKLGLSTAQNAGWHVPHEKMQDMLAQLPPGVRAQLEDKK